MSKMVVATASIMMNDYTLSDKMRHRTFRTVLFGRTSRNESWNHALRVFSAMYSHLSKNQEELNATVVTLIWNELTKHKVHALGTSKIEPRATKGKGKLRKKGRLAPVRQPRPLIMSWHTEMYTKLFGAEVQWWCKHHNDHLHRLREARPQLRSLSNFEPWRSPPPARGALVASRPACAGRPQQTQNWPAALSSALNPPPAGRAERSPARLAPAPASELTDTFPGESARGPQNGSA